MDTAARRLEFAPPPTPGFLRALVLAILAHGLLLAMLTVGVQWKREAVQQRFEAELWSSIPVEAAPPAPPPPVPEEPKPVPPVVKPVPKPEPTPPPAEVQKQADIALQKEKEKAKLLKDKQLALEKQELEKKKLAELEKQKQAKLEQDKKDKLDKQKKEQADKLAREKEDQQRKLDAKETANLAKTREEQLKRMEKLAGAGGNGAPGSTSMATEAKSLSNSYAGRIRSYIKRFLIYTEAINGNPTTEIEVRLASDGSILSRRITKPSGTKSWDEAALNAIDKAEKLPLDENGRAPSPMTIIWSAQEVTR